MDMYALVAAVLGSSTLSALITTIVGRKKLHADAMSVSVETALKLEERATTRYDSAQKALDMAQTALNAARSEIHSLQDYVDILHELLDLAGIAYPRKSSVLG